MKKVQYLLIVFLFTASSALQAQDADSLLLGDELDFLLSDDSSSIFKLIDSLLQADALTPSSQLSLRMGYNSNVLAAGRTLGIENFGLSPGLAFYHKSGLYTDFAGFWSKDFEPRYYLTIASVGYSHVFNKYFSVLGCYDRYFYHVQGDNAYIPYKNSFTLNPILDYKLATFSMSYGYYVGDKSVHRISTSVGVTLERKNIGPFKRIALIPSFVVLLGNEVFTQSEILIPKTRREALENLRLYGKIFPVIETSKNEFGAMNYSFSVPVSVSYKRVNLLFNYVYSVPKALPSETLTFSESSYISASLSYLFTLKSHKKTWQ